MLSANDDRCFLLDSLTIQEETPKFNKKNCIIFCIYRRLSGGFAKQNFNVMYVHPDAKLNGFKLVKIPSAHELMRQFGENHNLNHDGVNGENYVPAGNPNNVDNLDMLEQSRQELNAEIAERLREAKAKAQEPAVPSELPKVTE